MPARPTQRRSRISEAQILGAACSVFAEVGFEAATYEAIASAAHTSRVTLYSRFASKVDLYRAVMEREAAELQTRLLAAYAADTALPLAERLQLYVDAYFAYARERPAAFRLLFDERGTPEDVQPVVHVVTERVAQLFAGGDGRVQPNAEDRLVAALIIGAVHHGAGAAAASGDVDPERAATLTRTFLNRGVRMSLQQRDE